MATKKREEKRFQLKVWIGEYLIYNTIHILTKEQCAYWAKKFLTDYDTYDVVGHQMENAVLAGISTDEEKLAKVLKEHEDEIIMLGMESHVWYFGGLFDALSNNGDEFDPDFPDPEIKTILVEPITNTEGLMRWECKRIMPPPPKKRPEKKKKGPSLAEVLGVDETILKKPITDLDLSVRGFNVLKEMGVRDLSDILELFLFSDGTKVSLRPPKVKNFGKMSQEEVIESVFFDHGILVEEAEKFLGIVPRSEIPNFDEKVFEIREWSLDSQEVILRDHFWESKRVEWKNNWEKATRGQLVQKFVRKKKNGTKFFYSYFRFLRYYSTKGLQEVNDWLIEEGYLD